MSYSILKVPYLLDFYSSTCSIFNCIHYSYRQSEGTVLNVTLLVQPCARFPIPQLIDGYGWRGIAVVPSFLYPNGKVTGRCYSVDGINVEHIFSSLERLIAFPKQ